MVSPFCGKTQQLVLFIVEQTGNSLDAIVIKKILFSASSLPYQLPGNSKKVNMTVNACIDSNAA